MGTEHSAAEAEFILAARIRVLNSTGLIHLISVTFRCGAVLGTKYSRLQPAAVAAVDLDEQLRSGLLLTEAA